MNLLPSELVIHVMHFLNVRTLVSSLAVSKAFQHSVQLVRCKLNFAWACDRMDGVAFKRVARWFPLSCEIAVGKYNAYPRPFLLDINDEHLRVLAECCTSLTAINVGAHKGISGDCLRTIASYCPSLTELDLHECSGLSDAGLAHLQPGSMGLLEHLNLDGVGAAMTTVGFNTIFMMCQNLRELHLAHGCGLSCEYVTDAVVEAVGAHLHALECLSFSGAMVTQRSLSALGAGCPLLKEVCACHTMINTHEAEGFRDLARGCNQLTVLDLCTKSMMS